MAVDAKLAERVRAAATDEALQRQFDIREKSIFGGLAFMLNNKLACGVVGRPMRSHVFIAAAGCATQRAVDRWVARAAAHIGEIT